MLGWPYDVRLVMLRWEGGHAIIGWSVEAQASRTPIEPVERGGGEVWQGESDAEERPKDDRAVAQQDGGVAVTWLPRFREHVGQVLLRCERGCHHRTTKHHKHKQRHPEPALRKPLTDPALHGARVPPLQRVQVVGAHLGDRLRERGGTV
eukprot:5196313-Prymnesium_polylepis.1